MPDRTGQTSNFPNSLDQFAIKVPYNPDLGLSAQAQHSLEQASHFNHMFDAMYKIENYILGGSGGAGGQVVSLYPDGTEAYGSNVKIAYETVSVSMTGNTIAVTGLVPAAFGAEPFKNKGFSIAHTTYVTPREGAANVQGSWANKDWNPSGPFNEMIRWHQLFTMIRPVSGRVYELRKTNLPIHSTSFGADSIFSDSFIANSVNNLLSRPGWSGIYNVGGAMNIRTSVNGEARWRLECEADGSRRWGWAWPTMVASSTTDVYVEWGPIDSVVCTGPDVGDSYTRCGPMVRATGTASSAHFYCVSLGDIPNNEGTVTGDRAKYGRVMLVRNADLTNHTTSGNIWATPASATALSPYLWFGDLDKRYRLSITGSSIVIQSATAPYTSWSTLYGPYGDTTLSSGYAGFFTHAMDNAGDRYILFRQGVKVGLITSTPLIVETKLLFLQVSPEGSLTMEAD